MCVKTKTNRVKCGQEYVTHIHIAVYFFGAIALDTLSRLFTNMHIGVLRYALKQPKLKACILEVLNYSLDIALYART